MMIVDDNFSKAQRNYDNEEPTGLTAKELMKYHREELERELSGLEDVLQNMKDDFNSSSEVRCVEKAVINIEEAIDSLKPSEDPSL
jgi:hypothetical protein